MNKHATLHYGKVKDVVEILQIQPCNESELRAALINALNKIGSLEEQVVRLNNITSSKVFT